MEVVNIIDRIAVQYAIGDARNFARIRTFSVVTVGESNLFARRKLRFSSAIFTLSHEKRTRRNLVVVDACEEQLCVRGRERTRCGKSLNMTRVFVFELSIDFNKSNEGGSMKVLFKIMGAVAV